MNELTILGLLLLVCALDAFVPIVPSESMVIAASVMAAHGDLSLWPIPILAALGSFVGDHVSYGAGRMLQRRGHGRWFRSPRSRGRLAWAAQQIDGRGATLIVTARFVPGGRTVTTFAAGALGMRWRRFALADACAAVLWATVANRPRLLRRAGLRQHLEGDCTLAGPRLFGRGHERGTTSPNSRPTVARPDTYGCL